MRYHIICFIFIAAVPAALLIHRILSENLGTQTWTASLLAPNQYEFFTPANLRSSRLGVPEPAASSGMVVDDLLAGGLESEASRSYVSSMRHAQRRSETDWAAAVRLEGVQAIWMGKDQLEGRPTPKNFHWGYFHGGIRHA
jgi:hypothetical protein